MARRVGKLVRGALYVHGDAVLLLPPERQAAVRRAAEIAAGFEWNVARLDNVGVVGLLRYADFETEAFPRLFAAARVELDGCVRYTSYAGSWNPLILHRKELLVGDDHPLRARWAEVTERIERLGLLEDHNRIGRLSAWIEMLRAAGLDSQGAPAR